MRFALSIIPSNDNNVRTVSAADNHPAGHVRSFGQKKKKKKVEESATPGLRRVSSGGVTA
jgi:hypothetical protein